ncbi:hypothetical protein Gorai_023901, partial [Gossypium raimondii]|nr:hypothetical protein [Gossypium raimondii]
MLFEVSRDAKLSLQEQDKDDLQLIEGDVSIGIEDGLPSIQFCDRVYQILYQDSPPKSPEIFVSEEHFNKYWGN